MNTDLLSVEFVLGEDFDLLSPEEVSTHLKNLSGINLAGYQVASQEIDVETFLDTVEHYGQNMDNYTDIIAENLIDYRNL